MSDEIEVDPILAQALAETHSDRRAVRLIAAAYNSGIEAERERADRLQEALDALIAAVQFEVPIILDGGDAENACRILLACAKDAQATNK